MLGITQWPPMTPDVLAGDDEVLGLEFGEGHQFLEGHALLSASRSSSCAQAMR